MTLQPNSVQLLVDAHVHLQPCFDLDQFLTAALTNFQQQSQQFRLNQPMTGALLLAEISGVNAFADLLSQQDRLNQQLLDWEICPTSEAHSLWFKHTTGHSLMITAGCQVVTQEGIEVLALITEAAIEDQLSLTETLDQVVAAKAVPVLPWGVGKWLGSRGKLVKEQLQTAQFPLFAGDNGGRPRFWPLPDYAVQGIQLPGSDPLPLPNEVYRAGSFGFLIEGYIDWAQPGESLKQILLEPQPMVRAYGRSLSFLKFIQNQSLIRLQ